MFTSNLESCIGEWKNSYECYKLVDLRSAGYFHITRDSIQRCLHERFTLHTEEESQDYLSFMHTNNDKTLQKNTRLDIRKIPIDETEKPP